MQERFGHITQLDRRFDLDYWKQQGPEAIFVAAEQMTRDYLLLKEGYAHEPRLQRTVGGFKKV